MIPTERRHRQQTISRETAAAIMTQTSTTQPTTQQTPTASAHPIHQNSNHPNNITSSTDRQRRKAITAAATITEPRMTTQRRKNERCDCCGPAGEQVRAESSSFLKNRAGSSSFLNNLTEEGQARMKLMDGQGSGGVSSRPVFCSVPSHPPGRSVLRELSWTILVPRIPRTS